MVELCRDPYIPLKQSQGQGPTSTPLGITVIPRGGVPQTSVITRGGPLPPPTPGHHRPVLNIGTFAIDRLSVRGNFTQTTVRSSCDTPRHHKHRDSTSSCAEDRAAAGKAGQLQIRGRLGYCTPHSVVLVLCKAVIFPREIVGCLHRWRHNGDRCGHRVGGS